MLQIFDYFLSFCASLEEVAWRVVSDNFDIDVVQHFLKEKDPTQGYSKYGVIESFSVDIPCTDTSGQWMSMDEDKVS